MCFGKPRHSSHLKRCNRLDPNAKNRHSREGGNPVHFGFPGCKDSLDSRLRENDGDGV